MDTSHNPLSFKNILAAIIVTAIGSIIVAIIIQHTKTASVPEQTQAPQSFPTREATDSSTPEVNISIEASSYLDVVIDSLERMSKARDNLIDLLEAHIEAHERGQMTVDQSWQTDVAAEIAVFQREYELLAEAAAPPGLEELHATLLNAIDDCRNTMHYPPSEPDTLTLENLRTMLDLISSCSDELDVALDMMSELVPSPDGKP